MASFWQQQETDEVSTALQEAFNNLVMENPSDPLRFLGAEFTRLSRDPNQLATSSLKDKGAEAVLAALLDGEPKVRVASDEPLPAKTEGLPYWGGAFGDDGKLYLIARESRRVMTFDPRTERWGSFGEELPARPNKWLGAARCSDGCIYALPGGARQALKIDPAARGPRRSSAMMSPPSQMSPPASATGTRRSSLTMAFCTASLIMRIACSSSTRPVARHPSLAT